MKRLIYFICILSLFMLITVEVRSENIPPEIITHVDEELWKWIKRIAFLVGGVVAILGFLGFRGFGYVVTIIVNRKIEEGIKEVLKEEKERTKKNNLRFELNELINEAKTKQDYNNVLTTISPLFEKAKQTGDKDLIGRFLEKLISLNFELVQYETINKLQQEFGKDIQFTFMTWSNIAIANMVLYGSTTLPTYKKSSFDACDNAIFQLPDYGIPRAIELIIFMIDYGIAKDINEKENVKNETKNLIDTILRAPSVTAYETFEYLIRSEGYESTKKYVEILNDLFHKPMKKMEERYNEYIKKGTEIVN